MGLCDCRETGGCCSQLSVLREGKLLLVAELSRGKRVLQSTVVLLHQCCQLQPPCECLSAPRQCSRLCSVRNSWRNARLPAACKYVLNKGGGLFFLPMRFAGISVTQGGGRRAHSEQWAHSNQPSSWEQAAKSPAWPWQWERWSVRSS